MAVNGGVAWLMAWRGESVSSAGSVSCGINLAAFSAYQRKLLMAAISKPRKRANSGGAITCICRK
jgi:hypothetical protein